MQSLGTAYFTSNMLPALEESFADSVAKVRLEAANALIGLHESAGSEWLQTNIMPSLKEKWESSTYYLQRITVLEACKSLGKTKIAGDLMNDVTELTLKGLSDAVPNVRFAACEAANSLFAQLDASGLPPFKSKLEGLLTDDDQDVKFYATQALEACAA